MSGGRVGLKHAELTEKVVGIFYDVCNGLGYGVLESVYEELLVIALREEGFGVERQLAILNFGSRPRFRRLLFDNERKKFRENPSESVARVSA